MIRLGLRRSRRRRYEPLPDDGRVALRGYLVRPDEMSANAQALMAGFDDLPRSLRDRINYAPTAEQGANPPADILRGEHERQILRMRASLARFVELALEKSGGQLAKDC